MILRNIALILCGASFLAAAQDRIPGPVDNARQVALKGHTHPSVQNSNDLGPADPSMSIDYATLLLKPAPGLATFLAAQQDPSSPDYHKWLTPDQFGERFGLSTGDLDKVVSWLKSEGFRVRDVARGRNWITFSGTAQQAGRAFHTQIHRYSAAGGQHYANASDPSIPAALENVVSGIAGLDDFGWKSMITETTLLPYNNPVPGAHALAPDDYATIYNLNPLYNAGIDGSGINLVILGQTALLLSDIRTFRRTYNLPANDPQVMLFGPDPGVVARDLPEADLDLEWSGAIARKANIIYAYAQSVSVAAEYAVDNNLGSVFSLSYGGCELSNSPAFQAVLQQANAQGITWFVSSGDSGAATCDRGAPTPQASRGATVSFPASAPEVTAVGGTEFTDGSSKYWASTNNANGGSALSYVPERAWNDFALDGSLSTFGTGGGASGYFSKPLWQAGPGVPAANARHVPDVALSASVHQYPYLAIFAGTLVGFGGTSASSPAFAGIAALLNQYLISKSALTTQGLGNINPVLYRMAQAPNDVFHDLTEGDNRAPCAQASPDCVNGSVGFSAGPGYDLTTGLGSVDAFHLVTEWNPGRSSTLKLTSDVQAYVLADTVHLTATVTGTDGAPGGTVAFVTNDTTLALATLSSAGIATATVSGAVLAAGNGNVSAIYSGDSVFTGSTATLALTFNKPATATGSLVVAAANPNPVSQSANSWIFSLSLTEKNGVATTLTGATINGQNILTLFPDTKIPAGGSVFTTIQGTGFVVPTTRTFVFTGRDASGTTWSQQLIVSFQGPSGAPFGPSISLTSPLGSTPANAAGASCAWTLVLNLRELGGFQTNLTALSVDGVNRNADIQQTFGTTRLAPFGTLAGSLCFPATAGPAAPVIQVTGTGELGTVTASLSARLAAAPASTPSVPFLSPPAVTFSTTDASQVGAGTLSLQFSGDSGSSTAWTAVVTPLNGTANWLKISSLRGTGNSQLSLEASPAGLSPGAYTALVSVSSASSVPQVVSSLVTLEVGGSAGMKISGLQNSFSFATSFAPGMLMSVYGSNLAPDQQKAARLPLPLTMQGVSATVNGVSAPLYFVSPGQINLQVPYETGLGPAVVAINNNGKITSTNFAVSVTAPGLFTSAVDATGALAASAAQGQVLLLFMTGEGDVTPTLATGATPSSAIIDPANLPKARLPVTVTVGGVAANVLFAGITNGVAGVTQINVAVPANAPPGPQPVVVTVGSVASPPIQLTVTAK